MARRARARAPVLLLGLLGLTAAAGAAPRATRQVAGAPTVAAWLAGGGAAADANPNDFDVLAALAARAGMGDVLGGAAAVTLFAFNDLAAREAAVLLLNVNVEEISEARAEDALVELVGGDEGRLRELLLYHVVPGRLGLEEVAAAGELETANARGDRISVVASGDSVHLADLAPSLQDALVTAPDIAAANGVVHVVNYVMFNFDVTPAWHEAAGPPPEENKEEDEENEEEDEEEGGGGGVSTAVVAAAAAGSVALLAAAAAAAWVFAKRGRGSDALKPFPRPWRSREESASADAPAPDTQDDADWVSFMGLNPGPAPPAPALEYAPNGVTVDIAGSDAGAVPAPPAPAFTYAPGGVAGSGADSVR